MTKRARLRCCPVAAWTVGCYLALACGGASSARAQAIDSFHLIPTDSTDLIETYGTYDHYDAFKYSNGQKVGASSLDSYTATVRYAHFFSVAGYPAGLQLFQPVSYTANLHFGGIDESGAPGVRSLGAGNTTFSAFFWPYAQQAQKTYLYTAVFLSPPDGSYSSSRGINAAYGGWQGDAQVGGYKGFGANLSVEAAFDTEFHGDEPIRSGYHRSIDPTYRIQTWLNWDWTSALRTSVGYTGIFGGAWTESAGDVHYDVPRNAESQRIRVAASYWWTPRILTSVELAHDVGTRGGYRLGIGATTRVRVYSELVGAWVIEPVLGAMGGRTTWSSAPKRSGTAGFAGRARSCCSRHSPRPGYSA